MLFCIIGKSASGKDTVLENILGNTNLKKVVNVTTRPKRENEVDGVDYKFISEVEFLEKMQKNELETINSFKIEEDVYWYYGVEKMELKSDDHKIMICNPKQLQQLIECGKYDLNVIHINIPNTILQFERMLKRDGIENIKEIGRRIDSDEKDFEAIEKLLEEFVTFDTSNDIEELGEMMVDILDYIADCINEKPNENAIIELSHKMNMVMLENEKLSKENENLRHNLKELREEFVKLRNARAKTNYKETEPKDKDIVDLVMKTLYEIMS